VVSDISGQMTDFYQNLSSERGDTVWEVGHDALLFVNSHAQE
jgi:hypothetical protein